MKYCEYIRLYVIYIYIYIYERNDTKWIKIEQMIIFLILNL